MQLIKPPSDNLYKFIAIFGLVITIYCPYQTFTLVDSLYKQEYTIKLKEDLYNLIKDNNKINLESEQGFKIKEDSIKIANEKKIFRYELDRKVDKFIPFLLIGTFIGILTMLIGLTLWYKKTQRYQDLILTNEAEKSLIERKQYKDKVQFEIELDFYKKLWKDLTYIKLEIFNVINNQKKYKEEKNRNTKALILKHVRTKLKELEKPMINLLFFIGENELFYTIEFKKKLKNIRLVFRNTIKEIQQINKLSEEYEIYHEFEVLQDYAKNISTVMEQLLIDTKERINEYGFVDMKNTFTRGKEQVKK